MFEKEGGPRNWSRPEIEAKNGGIGRTRTHDLLLDDRRSSQLNYNPERSNRRRRGGGSWLRRCTEVAPEHADRSADEPRRRSELLWVRRRLCGPGGSPLRSGSARGCCHLI